MRVDSVPAIPYEVVSTFTRSNDKGIEIHQYAKVNGGNPTHFIQYIVYDKFGKIKSNQVNHVDTKA